MVRLRKFHQINERLEVEHAMLVALLLEIQRLLLDGDEPGESVGTEAVDVLPRDQRPF